MTPREQAKCQGKHPYETYFQAKRARRYKNNLDIYRCEFCGFYHIGRRKS